MQTCSQDVGNLTCQCLSVECEPECHIPSCTLSETDMKRLEGAVRRRCTYEDLSFNSETGHDQNLLRLLRNATQFVPKLTVKQWKLCQRASTCANVPIMTSLKIK